MSIAQELSEKILQIVEKKPVCQNELVYLLGIKHDQRISEAIKILLNNHKISRTKKGLTFILKLNGVYRNVNVNGLLYNNKFSPCCGCTIECVPSTCHKIDNWIK